MADIKGAQAYKDAIARIKQGMAMPGSEKTAGQQGPNFADVLKNTIRDTVEAQRNSERVSAAAVAGKANITDVLQAVTEAEMSLSTVLAVRDRVIRAYEEVMRSPI